MLQTGHIFSTRRGRKVRAEVMKRDLYRCQMCGLIVFPGRHKSTSAVVDHLVPVELAPELELEKSNLWTVCKGCHDGPCQFIEKRAGNDPDEIVRAKRAYLGYDNTGRPRDPQHPWNL